MDDIEVQPADTLSEPDDKKSSSVILKVLKQSERAFEKWDETCRRIDDIYSKRSTLATSVADFTDWSDGELDLFWASYEILKPATYAKPPQPVVSTQFKDRDPVKSKTAELLERVSVSNFDRSNIDDVMCGVRDDLIFTNRGVMWLTYEKEDGEQCVHIEHLERPDFLHEVCRKWSENGWVARRAWMTAKAVKKRFKDTAADVLDQIKYTKRRDDERSDVNEQDASNKASIWEVWHKADNKVYWVSEGVDQIIEEGAPHLKLRDFWPCPRPAYGTLQRRSLIPVPDYERYAVHFNKIDTLTSRIYLLLDKVKLKGLIPAGGDIADAVQELIRSEDDEILIPVPAAAMGNAGADFVAWLPLDMVATALQGLIDARTKLIDDYYQLSGISDIMRGATEAEETLGAQQLKGQYGSIRVRQKIDELQRIAADAVRIAAEIIADNFTKETLLEMSQMKISSKADIEKQIKGIEKAGEQELNALAKKAEEAAPQVQEQGPEAAKQAEQEFMQAQQAIVQKYAPQLEAAQSEVPIEDIMDLLRNNKARGFAFEIASDSTVLTDEIQEKASRNEFMTTFAGASQSLMQMAAMGEAGAALAGGLLSFVLGPYRIGRELDGLIDNFIDAAPQMAAQAAGQGGEEAQEGLIAAQNTLAQAEQVKAQAAMANVQAKAAQAQADNERKMAELQLKAQNDAAKLQAENQKLQLQMADIMSKNSKTQAEIDKLRADTAKILASIGLDVRKQDLDEYKTANDAQMRQVEAANAAEQQQVDTALKVNSEGRAERQQEFTETSTDRQMTMQERQALNGNGAK